MRFICCRWAIAGWARLGFIRLGNAISPARGSHRRSWSVALRVSFAGLRVRQTVTVTVTVGHRDGCTKFPNYTFPAAELTLRFVIIMMATPRPRPPGIQPSLILEVVATEPGPGSVVS